MFMISILGHMVQQYSAKAYLVYKCTHKVNETTLHLGQLFSTVSVHHGLRETERGESFMLRKGLKHS